MPNKRRRMRCNRRRRRRRRGKLAPVIVQNSQVKRLIYEQTETASLLAGVNVINLALSGNSISNLDPSGSVTIRPIGYDQWANLYTYYEVLHAKCQITVYNATGAIDLALIPLVGDVPTDDISYERMAANKYSHVTRIVPNTGAPALNSVSIGIAPRKLWGAKKFEVGPFRAAFGESPDLQLNWLLAVAPITESTTDIGFDLRIRTVQTTRIYGRVPLLEPSTVLQNRLTFMKKNPTDYCDAGNVDLKSPTIGPNSVILTYGHEINDQEIKEDKKENHEISVHEEESTVKNAEEAPLETIKIVKSGFKGEQQSSGTESVLQSIPEFNGLK